MTIKIECPECEKAYRLPDDAAGKKFRCKDCDAAVIVPGDNDIVDDFEEDERPVRRKVASKEMKKPRKAKKLSIWSKPGPWIGLYLGLSCLGMVTLFVLLARFNPNKFKPSTAPVSLYPVADIPVPVFPELGAPRVLQPSGVRMWFVQMPPSPIPGHAMGFRVYLPPTDAPDHSIPCVLVAPAGSNLLVGNNMDGDDYHVETLPYAEAGMAVIFYSIDGGVRDLDDVTYGELRTGNQQFNAAGAGVVNGRNALEYVLRKLPQVNPQKIFTAGHSSAGTLSLLMAEHEPRLAGSISYCASTDIETDLGEFASHPNFKKTVGDVSVFLKQSSPKTHVAHINCPIFLFHANDDTIVNIRESRNFEKQLQAAGKQVEFQMVPTGNHYNSMVKQGIPAAIAWLKRQNAKSATH